MFKIGEFSKICRVPASMLRYYAKMGLFEPQMTDPFTGYRYYSLEQLPRLNRILALRDLGLSIEQMQTLLNNGIDAQELNGILKLKRLELAQEIQEAQARLERVSARIRQIEQENKMPDYEIITKEAESLTVASIRETVARVEEMPNRCGAMFTAIAQWMAKNSISHAGPALAIYHNPEYTEEDIDVENAFVISANVEQGEFEYEAFTIQVYQLPAIPLVASTVHRGDFKDLIQAWQALARWIDENAYRIIGTASREFYLNMPGEPPVAEIQYAIEAAQ